MAAVSQNEVLCGETFSPILPIASFVGTHPILSHQCVAPRPRKFAHSQETPPQMVTSVLQFGSLNDVRDYVNQIFCSYYQLQLGAFQMTERLLVRGGKPCGVHYCLHGPRAVRFTAIWETLRNRILFYDSAGERFFNAQVIEAPDLDRVAA